MSVNSLLYSIQNMTPIMFSVGTSKTQNYSNLAELFSDQSSESSNSLLSGIQSDTVSLTYDSIGQQIITDMAEITASAIKEFPNLDDNYVVAVIDDGESREARVYLRSEILENFAGTEEEQAELNESLTDNSLVVFNNDTGLPATSEDIGAQSLAADLNTFLNTNSKTLGTLNNAGYDPFVDMLGDSIIKKILAYYAEKEIILEDSKETSSVDDTSIDDDNADATEEIEVDSTE